MPFAPLSIYTNSFANSSEHRKYVDVVLKEELGPMYVGLCNFHETFLRGVADLETASKAVFKKCRRQKSTLLQRMDEMAERRESGWCLGLTKATGTAQQAVHGSTAERKLDIGFVTSKAWLDLGRYVRGVLAAQDTRRFVLGFTICGSLMRIWEFDRLGGIASKQFDISEDGLQFVSTILAFLWMNEEQLGFDPTVITENGQRRLIIDGLMMRARCISGRTPLVIKDSWQYIEREEEGELLREVTEKGVVNVDRYYYYKIVRVLGTDNDVRSNVRKGLDIIKAENYRPGRSMISSSTSTASTRKSRSSSTASLKRKRSCSISPTKAGSNTLPNRVYQRVILQVLLAALEGCIKRHEPLRKAGFLYKNILINNLIINKDKENPF
ncbi:hypothetical protein DL98DRAFT_555026 [Cadophora sp. DSE1049]|nr:hypothetical protein DL98DRAFT_555026 [Cadophora sp. DSE1049]